MISSNEPSGLSMSFGRQVRDVEMADGHHQIGPIRNRYAVVIGIDSYSENRNFATLQACVRDAKRMEELLRSKCKYEVMRMIDDPIDAAERERFFPTRENIEREIKTHYSVTGADDLFLLYFAGHGFVWSGDSEAYLSTWDSKIVRDEATGESRIEKAIKLSDLRQWLFKTKLTSPDESLHAQRVVLILDGCHLGVDLGRGTDDKHEATEREAITKYAHELASGFVIMSASTREQKAQESSLNGLFTSYVVTGLSPGGPLHSAYQYVTVTALSEHAKAGVIRECQETNMPKQEPTLFGEDGAGIILADFRRTPNPNWTPSQQKVWTVKDLVQDTKDHIPDFPSFFHDELRESIRVRLQRLEELEKQSELDDEALDLCETTLRKFTTWSERWYKFRTVWLQQLSYTEQIEQKIKTELLQTSDNQQKMFLRALSRRLDFGRRQIFRSTLTLKPTDTWKSFLKVDSINAIRRFYSDLSAIRTCLELYLELNQALRDLSAMRKQIDSAASMIDMLRAELADIVPADWDETSLRKLASTARDFKRECESKHEQVYEARFVSSSMLNQPIDIPPPPDLPSLE